MCCLKIADVYFERSKEYYRQENAKEYAFITADEYTESQVVAMEKEILTALDFDLNQPSIASFLSWAYKSADIGIEIQLTASFLGDLSLLSSELQENYMQSEIAITVIFLARQVLKAT